MIVVDVHLAICDVWRRSFAHPVVVELHVPIAGVIVRYRQLGKDIRQSLPYFRWKAGMRPCKDPLERDSPSTDGRDVIRFSLAFWSARISRRGELDGPEGRGSDHLSRESVPRFSKRRRGSSQGSCRRPSSATPGHTSVNSGYQLGQTALTSKWRRSTQRWHRTIPKPVSRRTRFTDSNHVVAVRADSATAGSVGEERPSSSKTVS